MKAFVQKVIEDYPRYLQEEATFERHLETRENSDMRDALTMLKIRLGIVESWFALLDADERFAFRQTLQTDLNDTPARRAAAMMWIWRLIKGPTVPDRVVAGDCVDVLTDVALVLVALYSGRGIYLDIAIVTAILGFLSQVLIGKYLEGTL